MKLRIERDALADAVTWTARSLPSRSPVPVLTGLLLEAGDDALRLSAFDYEISARMSGAADVADGGRVLVSGKLLAEIVRSLPARPVDLVTDGSRMRITCGSSKFTLLTMPVDDYPSLPAMPAGSGVVDGALFTQAVGQVSIAASRDDSPPMLAGVRVEIDGDELTLMATDRYRLAMRTIPWKPATPDLRVAALLRAKTLTEVTKTLGGDITIALGADGTGNLIGFEAGARRSTSLLMDGQYPPVRNLFPASVPATATVDVAELTEAAKRVSLVAERHTAIRLTFTDGTLTLAAGQGEDAQADEAIGCTYQGGGDYPDDMSIGVNPQYFLDGISALTQPTVKVSLTAPGKPMVLTGQGPDGTDDTAYRYLLMPMKL